MNKEIIIHQSPQPQRKDSFWFDGHVATVTDGKTTVNIIAQGHTDVVFNPNEESFSNAHARKEARSRGYTDRKLHHIIKHDGWNNNNWFSFEVHESRFKKDYYEWDTATEINFDEAIETAKEILKEKSVTN